MQVLAHGKKIPDHFVRTVTETMKGLHKSSRRQPVNLRRCYEAQDNIGWEHFLCGRLSKSWGSTRPVTEGHKNQSEWVKVLAAFVLTYVKEKWDFRCRVYDGAVKTKERRDLLREAEVLWSRRKKVEILAQDGYLFDEENRPSDSWSATRLRRWLQTRNLAIESARLGSSDQQNTLWSWLQRV